MPQADDHTDVPRAAIERFAEEGKADGVDRAVAFVSEDCFCLLELFFLYEPGLLDMGPAM